ncbi:MAG TPA: AAA family ATPase [Solirubrobacteraceae bacterium]|nr:AAA family ATPase [Solirubrobacteraceae bacterium]
MATLGDRLAARDREQFVGRDDELTLFDGLLAGEPATNVVLVHGPGGIGKSTLLREVARRAEERGVHTFLVDGRDAEPVPGRLEAALGGVHEEERPLVVFDTYERMTALGGWLRQRFLPSLPARAVVVIAGRRRPEADWFQGGWERLTLELELRPMHAREARLLAKARGVHDERALARLLDWAQGSPLALSLGADAARSHDWRPEYVDERPDLVRAIFRRLMEEEADGGEPEALAVAAVARVVTPRLLADVLPGVDTQAADRWLRSLSFAEPAAGGIALHELVRKAVRADLRRRRPEHERELRRRIADHLYARAASGELRLVTDLADLVENPALRWGLGAEGTVGMRVDPLRLDDLPELHDRLEHRHGGGPGFDDWWEATEALLRRAPERAILVRDAANTLCGYSYAATPANAPRAAEEDGVLGPWLAHARAHAPDGQALVWRDAIDVSAAREGDVSSPVLALSNLASVLRSGLRNPRWSYLPIDPANETAVEFASRAHARHVPDLDLAGAHGTIECWILDHGPGGMIGGIVRSVYAELGLPAPEPPAGVAPSLSAEDVREALRCLDRPTELAASPLARGATPQERVAFVRETLEEAAAAAFGDSPDERLLHDVLRRGYLEPGGSHESIAHDLHLSRATYFRKLKAASDRVAEWVAAWDAQ